MSITNLTGTKWQLKDTITVSSAASYAINFELTADGTQYAAFAIADSALKYGTISVYASATWSDDKYKVIHILGGTDVETSGLITWLSANAELKGGGMKFTQIPTDTFSTLQLNAGVLAKSFAPNTGVLASSDILGATTGGINFDATPSFEDFGSDIDNCPKNTKELKKLTEWDVKLSGTFATITAALAKTLIGAGDVSSDKVTPRNDIATADFADIWWIGDYSDKNGATNGGFVAIHMLNGLSTGGFKIQSSDKNKGNFAFEFTGHYSIAAQTTVPFEVYVHAGTAEQA